MIVTDPDELARLVAMRQAMGERIVFTNGVFDLLHVGHLRYLAEARALGDALCVAVNADSSVKQFKGDKRPIVSESERMELLDGLRVVDYVTLFKTRTPAPLIEQVRPALYVKGGDYRVEDLPEAVVVQSYGGHVEILSLIAGRSSTNIIEKICEAYGPYGGAEPKLPGAIRIKTPMSLSVLQVASSFPNWGGTELHILNLSDQLRRRGHDVTIACRPGRWVEERAQQMGLPTVPITVLRQQDWSDFGKMRRFLRTNKIDVMHVHWSLDMIVPGVAAVSEGVPVRILSRHMPYPFKKRLGRMLYSRLFTRMVTVSNSVRNTLVECGIAPDKVEVIHHGTDVESFARTTQPAKAMRRELGIPEDRVAIGIVGRIAPEKGHSVLLDAARTLGDRYPVQYVVIGNGPDEEKMREQARQLEIADRVSFTGFRDDVNNAMSALDVVAVPSTWNEPCSAVVQQAMALSKPVIGTSVGGTPEMVRECVTGLLVPPSDPSALADAIARLAGDAFLRKQMGEAGREVVEAQFSLRVMTDKIESLYRREYENARGAEALQKALAS